MEFTLVTIRSSESTKLAPKVWAVDSIPRHNGFSWWGGLIDLEGVRFT